MNKAAFTSNLAELRAVVFTQSGKKLVDGMSFLSGRRLKTAGVGPGVGVESSRVDRNTDSGVGVDSIEMTIDSATLVESSGQSGSGRRKAPNG